MSAVPLIRANALVPFIVFLEEAGAPGERLMQDVGLSPRLFENTEQFIPLRQCLAFVGHIAQAQELSDLGLRVGLRSSFDNLGAFARCVRGALTLEDALNRLICAAPLNNSGTLLSLCVAGEEAAFCHRFTSPDCPGQRQGELFALAMMIQAIRCVLGPDWIPDGVRLPFQHEMHRKQYEATFQIPVACSGALSMVRFRSAVLSARPYRLCRDGSPDNDQFLTATAPKEDFAGAMRQVIASLFADGYPTIRRTAKAVGLSVRTLQRQLASSGETYSNLIESVRLATCVPLLRDTDIKIVDIAGELGYEDSSNFSRAFRRWTGSPPRHFRQGHR